MGQTNRPSGCIICPRKKRWWPKSIERFAKEAVSSEVRDAVEQWGRQSDFLRLYQAIYIGLRMQQNGVRHLHAHFAGMAARTAYWVGQFFGIPYSFTAHANDIFAPRDFVVSLRKLIDAAAAIVTVSEYSVRDSENALSRRRCESASHL